MKEIQLTQGKVALVDDADFEYLNQWKWHASKKGNLVYAKGYLRGRIRVNGKVKWVSMHRINLRFEEAIKEIEERRDSTHPENRYFMVMEILKSKL